MNKVLRSIALVVLLAATVAACWHRRTRLPVILLVDVALSTACLALLLGWALPSVFIGKDAQAIVASLWAALGWRDRQAREADLVPLAAGGAAGARRAAAQLLRLGAHIEGGAPSYVRGTIMVDGRKERTSWRTGAASALVRRVFPSSSAWRSRARRMWSWMTSMMAAGRIWSMVV